MPETAAGQIRRIMQMIRSFEEMPVRYRLYKEEPWHSQGIRFFPVDDYPVFYLPEEFQNTVNIVELCMAAEMCAGSWMKKMFNKELLNRHRK